jgi:hypothetical protein
MKNIFIFLFLLAISVGSAQKSSPTPTLPVLQFSGVVLDQDSLTPIPFVAVLVKGTKRGTVSDIYGFFTIVAYPGDVLEFQAMTHKSRAFRISDSIRSPYHSIIQVLTKDTVDLPLVDVRPWPSKEDFKRAFLNLDLSDTDAERADRNISRDELSYLERNAAANGGENYMYVMQNYYTKVYAAGQSAQNRLMSPLAWAEFINAWKSGKLSNQNKKKTK